MPSLKDASTLRYPMLSATPVAICQVLSQLDALPLVFGTAGTVAWIISGLPSRRPFADELQDVRGRRAEAALHHQLQRLLCGRRLHVHVRHRLSLGREPDHMAALPADPEIGPALIQCLSEQDDLLEALARSLEAVGRRVAGSCAIVMCVMAAVAQVANWHYASLLACG
jgi:hypothetical protein